MPRLGYSLGWLLVLSAVMLGVRPVQAARWQGMATPAFANITAETGLPRGLYPTAIAEDADGFVWIGTQGGLARWDGSRFRLVGGDASEPGALPDAFVRTLHTDRNGTLWIGTSAGGLARLDRAAGQAVPVAQGKLSHPCVRAIADDARTGAGGLWLGTDGGLDHLDPARGTVVHVRHVAGDPGSLPANQVSALLLDRSGRLWVGTSGGLAVAFPAALAAARAAAPAARAAAPAAPAGGGLSLRFVPVTLPSGDGSRPIPWVLAQDSAGTVWVGTTHNGAFAIRASAGGGQAVGRAEKVVERGVAGDLLDHERVYAIAEARAGEVWLGTFGQGIVAVAAGSGETRRIAHDPLVPLSLADDTVWALHRDRAGLMWVGTQRSLSRFDPANAAVNTVFGGPDPARPLTDPDVHAVMQAPDGRVWLGLGSNGVDILDPARGRVAQIRPHPETPGSGLPRDLVNAMIWTAPGVYLGTDQGLYLADPKRLVENNSGASPDPHPATYGSILDGRPGGGEGRCRTCFQTDSTSLAVRQVTLAGHDPAEPVRALLAAGETLFVGTSHGLARLSGGQAQTLPAGVLTDQRVTALAQAADGAIWIGTQNGLNRLDPGSGAVEQIAPGAGASGLAGHYVIALLIDRRGGLWVGTLGGGVNRLVAGGAAGHRRFRHWGRAEGLANANVDALIEAVDGAVWAGTDNGLARIDPASGVLLGFGAADGVAIAGTWNGAVARSAVGELMFGGLGGLTVVQPAALQAWTYRPPVAITSLQVGGVARPAAGSAGLVVRPGANSLAVTFAALDYSAPERLRYAYQLEGFDADWVNTEAQPPVAAYTNLPPGRYTLHLRGSNRTGVWSEAAPAVVEVQPAWFQTRLFKAGFAIATTGLMIAFVQLRTARLRAHQRQLEAQVEERTAALRASQQELEKIAYYDALTTLANRRMFTEEFRSLIEFSRRQETPFALILIDLDRFKQINDTMGHDAGDALLAEAAARLLGVVRETDRVARLGGDEFAILLPNTSDPAAIEALCERIVNVFKEGVGYKGAILNTSSSVGVAAFPQDGMAADTLYKRADLALYAAKHAGRSTWRRYSPAMEVAA